MTTGTEPARSAEPRMGGEAATLAWLDALVSGNCTADEFLSSVRNQFREDGDGTWEVLALVDQYYRRGKMKADLFLTLKSRLEGSVLDGDEDVTASLAATVAARLAASPVPRASTVVTAPVTNSQRKASPAPRPAAPREISIGDVLRQRYKVVGVLGHGGMGTVFEALDGYRVDLPTTSQRLAVKVLNTAVAQREELLTELQREFQHLQLLSHPNIVRVHEFDRDGDTAFFTMEFLNGALLSQVLGARKAAALPRPYALAIIRDVGAALAHAHSRGVVHGDVNPQNIFITNGGELRVLDFGASHKMLRDKWTADGKLSERAPVATAGYASCQLLEGQYPDARDDLFAFACVAYVLLSGRHPFPNRSAVEACAQGLRAPRPPKITGQQWRALREGLRWERDRRPADVQEWLQRLNLSDAAPRLPKLSELVKSSPPRKPGTLRAAAAAAMFVLLAAGAYWAVMNHDFLRRQLMDWNSQVRSAVDHAGTLPAAPAAGAGDQSPARPADQMPTPATAAPTAATPMASREAAPSQEAHPQEAAAPRETMPARTAAQTPARAPSARPPSASRRAAASQASAAGLPAHSANAGGSTRIELAADTVDVPSTETAAHVVVRRKGSLRGDASFTWWTESGTAKPNRDFAPVTPRVEEIADGSATAVLSIPVSGAPRTQPKSFYVVIDRTDSGAALGARTLTMVTLQPPDQSSAQPAN